MLCCSGRNASLQALNNKMLNTIVALPGVHMAGSDAHYNARIEVGQHGFALFLTPDAEYPVLDVNGTSSSSMSSSVRSKPPSRPVCSNAGH